MVKPNRSPALVPFAEVEFETEAFRRHSAQRQRRFLKGPIPWGDISAAAILPGKALALYIAVRHRADLTQKLTVTLPAHLCIGLGIGKDARARGLKHLEDAGLVRLERVKGQSVRIELANRNAGIQTPSP